MHSCIRYIASIGVKLYALLATASADQSRCVLFLPHEVKERRLKLLDLELCYVCTLSFTVLAHFRFLQLCLEARCIACGRRIDNVRELEQRVCIKIS